MNENLSKPVHVSYRNHRKELTWKILLPVILSVILCIGLTVLINLATFGGGADVQRWADISTMWIAIIFMLEMLVFLAVVGGMIFLLAKLLNITPRYTPKAQDFFYKVRDFAQRVADAVAKPFISIDSIGAGINRFLGRR